jgi:hypothetical protein
VTHFTCQSLGGLLERSGFEVLGVETVSALSYLRPARAVRPRSVVAIGKEMLLVRRSPWRADPERHELLRIAARRPA